MAIAASDLKLYASASRPEDDTSTSGGAIAAAVRFLTQFSASAVAAVISDGADTRTITITGRLASGVVDTEALVLTGAVEVVGAKTWERILKAVASGADGSRTVTLRQGSGGTARGTIGPNETELTISFKKAASDPSATRTRYEKVFLRNTHGTLALQNATVKLTADPAAKIRIGAATAVDDSGSVANRLTAPGSVVFVDDNVSQGVPGTNLAAGAAVGVWVEQALSAGNAPVKDTYTVQLAGESA